MKRMFLLVYCLLLFPMIGFAADATSEKKSVDLTSLIREDHFPALPIPATPVGQGTVNIDQETAKKKYAAGLKVFQEIMDNPEAAAGVPQTEDLNASEVRIEGASEQKVKQNIADLMWFLYLRSNKFDPATPSSVNGFGEGTFTIVGFKEKEKDASEYEKINKFFESCSAKYQRLSSHFKAVSVGSHYGIDFEDNMLPAGKRTLLLGNITFGNGTPGMFLKMENYGLTTPFDLIMHGIEYGESILRKTGLVNIGLPDDSEKYRKERVEVALLDAVKNLPCKHYGGNLDKVKKLGVQEIVSTLNEASKACKYCKQLMLLAQHLDSDNPEKAEFRFGREVILIHKDFEAAVEQGKKLRIIPYEQLGESQPRQSVKDSLEFTLQDKPEATITQLKLRPSQAQQRQEKRLAEEKTRREQEKKIKTEQQRQDSEPADAVMQPKKVSTDLNHVTVEDITDIEEKKNKLLNASHDDKNKQLVLWKPSMWFPSKQGPSQRLQPQSQEQKDAEENAYLQEHPEEKQRLEEEQMENNKQAKINQEELQRRKEQQEQEEIKPKHDVDDKNKQQEIEKYKQMRVFHQQGDSFKNNRIQVVAEENKKIFDEWKKEEAIKEQEEKQRLEEEQKKAEEIRKQRAEQQAKIKQQVESISILGDNFEKNLKELVSENPNKNDIFTELERRLSSSSVICSQEERKLRMAIIEKIKNELTQAAPPAVVIPAANAVPKPVPQKQKPPQAVHTVQKKWWKSPWPYLGVAAAGAAAGIAYAAGAFDQKQSDDEKQKQAN